MSCGLLQCLDLQYKSEVYAECMQSYEICTQCLKEEDPAPCFEEGELFCKTKDYKRFRDDAYCKEHPKECRAACMIPFLTP